MFSKEKIEEILKDRNLVNYLPSNITQLKIMQALNSLKIHYTMKKWTDDRLREDSDNREIDEYFVAWWDPEVLGQKIQVVMYFINNGDSFTIRAQSPTINNEYFPTISKKEIVDYCGKHNYSKLFPKAYVMPTHIATDLSVFNVSDVSDSYVEDFINNGINLSLEFFTDLAKECIAKKTQQKLPIQNLEEKFMKVM